MRVYCYDMVIFGRCLISNKLLVARFLGIWSKSDPNSIIYHDLILF